MKKLFDLLTVEEKINLLVGKDTWSNYGCNGKVYEFIVSDGPVGLRHPRKTEGNDDIIPAIAYPSTQILSHTWNKELFRRMGNAIANDCIEMNVDIILGPGINIKRMPTNGRNFEYASEDPLIAGILGREYIYGVQEKNIGTSLKHYCCNNMEYSRLWISSEVDERTLYEIYLKGFQIACEADPWTVMSSYNLVNGQRMSEHKKLYTRLRKEYGFNGAIISDWGAVKNEIASLEAGLDLAMPFDQAHLDMLMEAHNNGTLNYEKVDESAARVLELSEKCRKSKAQRKTDMTVEERENVALTIAREGAVLLKNDGVLPLAPNDKVFVTGAPARRYYYGGGSSEVTRRKEYVGLGSVMTDYFQNTTYYESCWETFHGQANMGNLKAAKVYAAENDVSIVCVGDDNRTESEGHDRQTIKLTKEEIDIINNISKVAKKTVVVIFAGSAIDMSDWIDNVDAVLYMGYCGDYDYRVLCEILIGEVNPSGKLTETFPLSLSDVPSMNSYKDGSCIVYGEGLNVGYRYFDTFDKPVLFPFGYGLSYSKFEYGDISVKGSGTNYSISFNIINRSNVDGYETAQLYVGELTNEVYRPQKELKSFEKVFVPAGSSAKVNMTIDKHAFEYYSTAIDDWKVHEGIYRLYVGANVSDIKLVADVKVN